MGRFIRASSRKDCFMVLEDLSTGLVTFTMVIGPMVRHMVKVSTFQSIQVHFMMVLGIMMSSMALEKSLTNLVG